MKYLSIGLLGLIITVNLVFAFHDGGQDFNGPEDLKRMIGENKGKPIRIGKTEYSITDTGLLSSRQFLFDDSGVGGRRVAFPRRSSETGLSDAGSGSGYWEIVPSEGGYQEGQYARRWVSKEDVGSSDVDGTGSSRIFDNSPFQRALEGDIGGSNLGSTGFSDIGSTGSSDIGNTGFSNVSGRGGSFRINNPLGGINTIQELVNRLINALIILATPIVVIMVLWGGFYVMTSAGESARYTKGGKIILYAAVGYGILLLAKGATAIIESIIYDII